MGKNILRHRTQILIDMTMNFRRGKHQASHGRGHEDDAMFTITMKL